MIKKTNSKTDKSIVSLQKLVVKTLEDLKAQDLHVIDVREFSDLADTFIICTGTSTRHVRSLADKLSDTLRESKRIVLGVEGQDSGEWVLVDAADVIVHIMLPEARDFYALEKLWSKTSKV